MLLPKTNNTHLPWFYGCPPSTMDAILVTIVLTAGANDLSKNASSSRSKKLHLYFIDLNTFQKQCPFLATPLECHPYIWSSGFVNSIVLCCSTMGFMYYSCIEKIQNRSFCPSRTPTNINCYQGKQQQIPPICSCYFFIHAPATFHFLVPITIIVINSELTVDSKTLMLMLLLMLLLLWFLSSQPLLLLPLPMPLMLILSTLIHFNCSHHLSSP